MRFEDLPYRPCVRVMVLNRDGRALIGRRIAGRDHLDATHHSPAALRELHEETNIRSVERLAEIDEWLRYDIPREIVGQAWKGKYRGQKQKWFALRFTGAESEIDLANPAGSHEPEFSTWRWEPMQNVPDLVVPFKRAVYELVVREFSRLVK